MEDFREDFFLNIIVSRVQQPMACDYVLRSLRQISIECLNKFGLGGRKTDTAFHF